MKFGLIGRIWLCCVKFGFALVDPFSRFSVLPACSVFLHLFSPRQSFFRKSILLKMRVITVKKINHVNGLKESILSSFVSSNPIAVIRQIVFRDSIKMIYGCQGIFRQIIK